MIHSLLQGCYIKDLSGLEFSRKQQRGICPEEKGEGFMELECPVLLNVGVSFAPTPSAPPQLGETTNKWLIQPCSCGQHHPLKFLEDIPKAIVCFVERQRT